MSVELSTSTGEQALKIGISLQYKLPKNVLIEEVINRLLAPGTGNVVFVDLTWKRWWMYTKALIIKNWRSLWG